MDAANVCGVMQGNNGVNGYIDPIDIWLSRAEIGPWGADGQDVHSNRVLDDFGDLGNPSPGSVLAAARLSSRK
jgi:hypothetical protein